MSIARTSATGEGGMLPELLAWSSSLELDRSLAREDLLGSAAHVTMLARQKLVEKADAEALRGALLDMFARTQSGELHFPDGEEDIHMAVEAELGRSLGAVAGRLHTARSRNDQVALDLRLFVREQAARALGDVASLLAYLAERAPSEKSVLLPAYTHRQRAQPISAAFLMCAWGAGLARAADVLAFAVDRADELPLGSGACSGSSLPIDRTHTARLLRFARVTTNALDTVGDRDFALDWTWAASRVLLAIGKLSADLVDYSTSEFGLVALDGRIAAGSSMMPQKKNPDIFELVRGKTARGIGNVVALLTLVKGLPSGYNRDQQEDRQTLLETAPLLRGALSAVHLSLPHVRFVGERGEAALADGFTQATDMAEALVKRGVPFREAYKAVGQLVRRAVERGIPLVAISEEEMRSVHAGIDAAVIAALAPRAAVAAKESLGGTGPHSVDVQAEELARHAERLKAKADGVPTLGSLAQTLSLEPIGPA